MPWLKNCKVWKLLWYRNILLILTTYSRDASLDGDLCKYKCRKTRITSAIGATVGGLLDMSIRAATYNPYALTCIQENQISALVQLHKMHVDTIEIGTENSKWSRATRLCDLRMRYIWLTSETDVQSCQKRIEQVAIVLHRVLDRVKVVESRLRSVLQLGLS